MQFHCYYPPCDLPYDSAFSGHRFAARRNSDGKASMNHSVALEKCYEALVREALSSVPKGPGKIWARSEIFDGVSTTALYYLSRRNEQRAVFGRIDKLDSAFNSLHAELLSLGEQPFTTAILSIERRRALLRDKVSFSLSYSYEDVSDMEFDQRATPWLHEIFGKKLELQYDE